MIPTLYIRADAKCGLGHVRRCQVLEREWVRAGGDVEWNDPQTQGVLVVDDYYYDNEERKMWRALGNVVVTISEFAEYFDTDVLLNQNIGARELVYPVTAPVMLLGPDYFLLGEHIKQAPIHDGDYTFDADEIKRGLSPTEFALALSGAKAIICSAGLTAYESLYLRKTVFLRLAAENQRNTYRGLISNGYAYAHTPENIKLWKQGKLKPLNEGRSLVDGQGPERVFKAILSTWIRSQAWKNSTVFG